MIMNQQIIKLSHTDKIIRQLLFFVAYLFGPFQLYYRLSMITYMYIHNTYMHACMYVTHVAMHMHAYVKGTALEG